MIMSNVLGGTLVGGGRQALWWVRYPARSTAADGDAVRAEAAELVGQLAELPHLAGWSFVVRDEPEQHRVTVVGTAPRPSAVS
jgi:hypothetical protein